ncbi:hypothetical protein NDU88_004575 [Pleurodeles waltl]|uniref:Uncharacterized protein n=1 Tax=Pleurodeles waltl TaxID=8319 RepID=A0AAV7W5M9_PLEWA|nr:hypothetical protein NDU88_004575 [Pleurodeles waltl]
MQGTGTPRISPKIRFRHEMPLQGRHPNVMHLLAACSPVLRSSAERGVNIGPEISGDDIGPRRLPAESESDSLCLDLVVGVCMKICLLFLRLELVRLLLVT